MASLNKVFLVGNLTRGPELRYTPSGSTVCTFGLAVNRKYKSGDEWKDETCFVDITVWGKQGEACAQYLSKGSAALIDGRLNFRTWETDDGQKCSKLDVVANDVQFLSTDKREGTGAAGGGGGEKSTYLEIPPEEALPF